MQQATYPVQFSVDYPDRPLDRLTTYFRLFTAIPHHIVLFFQHIAMVVVVIIEVCESDSRGQVRGSSLGKQAREEKYSSATYAILSTLSKCLLNVS